MSQEKKTLEKIVEHVGPYGLIAFCAVIMVNVASKPLDFNSWVSIGILGIIIGMSFLRDWLQGKNSSAIEQLRIKTELELEKHKSWVEGNKPLIESSSQQGQARMDRFKMLHAIVQLLENDLKEGKITAEQKAYCQDLKKRLKDIERTVSML